MNRTTNFILALAAFAGSAAAGTFQIQVGGTNGLTAGYIAGGCSTNVAGQTCVTGSATNFFEQNYDQRLFQNATLSTAFPSSFPNSTTSASVGSLSGSGTYDSGTVFSMINDGCNNGTTSATCGTVGAVPNNFWQAQNSAGTGASITIPVGIFDVTEVATVLNNLYGTAGLSGQTTVTFNFSPLSANDTTDVTSVIVKLLNSGSTSTASGQIQGSIDCSIPASSPCNTYDIGPTATQSTSFAAGSSNTTGLKVDTDTVFSSNYSGITAGKYMGTSGSVSLMDQVFDFSGTVFDSGYYLESITVADSSGKNGTSESSLSAITVDTSQAPVPEPSTVLLMLAGAGMIGLSRLRRS